MSEQHPVRDAILVAFSDGKPKSHREIVKATGLTKSSVWRALHDYWKAGLLLRTERPIIEVARFFGGRSGIKHNMRVYYLYIPKPKGKETVQIEGQKFVGHAKKYLDRRGTRVKSKAKLILEFLKQNRDKAFYSTEVASALRGEGIEPCDVMATARRYERKGMVYVRGYRTHDQQTPFKQGYLLTWVNQRKSRDEAVHDAVERTEDALAGNSSVSPAIERIRIIRDQILAMTQLKDLASFSFLQREMGCSEREAEYAVKRALQLYPDLKEVKLFNNYRYFYHESMDEADLKASIKLKENYIRMTKGRDNRIGHNWEACVEWFVDKFTRGAEFQTQQHRTAGMDSRRITLHLLRGVGDRKRSAEVDRVWQITPGVFAKPITYVLECKWGLVRKQDIDEFFDVLRWSKEFGCDTEGGRAIKQGVVGVFAGGGFDPKEKVYLKDGAVDLPTYAARMNIQLLKATDFNEKLRARGCKLTIQKICRVAGNEADVKEALDSIWGEPTKADEVINELIEKNKKLYEFERMLNTDEKGERAFTRSRSD